MRTARRSPPPKKRSAPFTLSDEAREQLAIILRPLKDATRSKVVIDALEEQARDFVETRAVIKMAGSGNSNAKALKAIVTLRRTLERAGKEIDALPRRAADLIAEVLILERAAPPGLPARLRRDLRLLGYAADRARGAVAPAPTGGRPVDHQGQNFAAEIASILGAIGIQPTTYTDGPLAECLGILFDAVGHQPGDMRTLLEAVRKKLGGLPPSTF
jgi:hypothetical protein